MEASYATRLLANLNNLRQNSNHGNLCDVEIGKITLLSSDGLGSQIPVFGFNMFHDGEMDLCKSTLQNDFLHFLPYLMIFQSETHPPNDVIALFFVSDSIVVEV